MICAPLTFGEWGCACACVHPSVLHASMCNTGGRSGKCLSLNKTYVIAYGCQAIEWPVLFCQNCMESADNLASPACIAFGSTRLASEARQTWMVLPLSHMVTRST